MTDETQVSSALLLSVEPAPGEGWQSLVMVDHQTIGFGPLCEEKEGSEWWCHQFKAALSRAGARFVE